MSREEQVAITAIAAGGEGVGQLADGRVVFVPQTVPGDRVRVEPVREADRWVRARLVGVDAPGAARRVAPCTLHARCGGCPLQQMSYAAQLEAKRTIVTDALTRIGRLDVEVPDVVPSPREFGYRNRVSFTLKRLAGGRVVAGYHALGAPGRIVDVRDECLLGEAPINTVWTALRAAWGPGARHLPAGPELRLTLRVVDEGVLLAIEGGHGAGMPDGLMADVPGLAAVWHRPAGGHWTHRAGRVRVHDRSGDEEVEVTGAAFLQVNREAAAALEDHVLHEAGAVAGVRVVDAYSGVAPHGRRLAALGARVTAIELDAGAAAAARAALPSAARVLEGTVEERLEEALPADLVILNPPRGGVDVQIPRTLCADPPRLVIYVSCDPATLARDLARMADTFEVRTVRAFDLFPQTAHVETVVTLAARTGGHGTDV